jgi:hypothetical protein
MPPMGTFPDPISPAIRANDAAGEAKASSNAIASFAEMLDMVKLHAGLAEADLGWRTRSHH